MNVVFNEVYDMDKFNEQLYSKVVQQSIYDSSTFDLLARSNNLYGKIA